MKNIELEIFKEIYHFEHERHDRLTSKLGIPITILTLNFGIITYYLQNVINFNNDFWTLLFYIYFFIAILGTILTIYYLIRSYYNYEYAYFPTPEELSNDIKKIKEYYTDPYFKDYKKNEIEELIENDINSLITDYYKNCSERNVANYNALKN